MSCGIQIICEENDVSTSTSSLHNESVQTGSGIHKSNFKIFQEVLSNTDAQMDFGLAID